MWGLITTIVARLFQELKIDDVVLGMHVLLLHTGGDSKRVPWANCIGKAFVPLPFLADEDPDASVPTLFDHILAISALALQAFSGKGCQQCRSCMLCRTIGSCNPDE